MKRPRLFLAVMLCYVLKISIAQNPCDEPGIHPDCFICSDTLRGDNHSATIPTQGATYECGTLENDVYYSFFADETSMEVDVETENCITSQGLQLIIYDKMFQAVTDCYPSATDVPWYVRGLVPGEMYWLRIDGFAGNSCDYTVVFTKGIDTDPYGPDLKAEPIVSFPTGHVFCQGQQICMESGDTLRDDPFWWDFGLSVSVKSGDCTNQICFTFNEPGFDTIRVSTTSGCSSIDVEEYIVEVLASEKTDLGEVSICENELPFEMSGILWENAGFNSDTLQASNGCDSIIELQINAIPPYEEMIIHRLCDGQAFQFLDSTYSQPGTYEYKINESCDTTYLIEILPGETIVTLVEESLCQGDTFLFQGMQYLVPGNYEIEVNHADDCDTIYQLKLNGLPNKDTIIQVKVREGNTFQNVQINKDTSFSRLFQTSLGCDSLVIYEIDATRSSVRNIINEDLVTLAPNPVAEELLISFKSGFQTPERLEIYNEVGQLKYLYHGDNFKDPTLTSFKIEMSLLPPGFYFLKIRFEEGGIVVKRLVKS
jgi:hypothetical protein